MEALSVNDAALTKEQAAALEPIDFVTLGMFIIDDIELPGKPASALNVPGGAGTYAALGARLFSPPPISSTVGWVIDQGSDFPAETKALVDTWQTTARYRSDAERLTTRGWNGYVETGTTTHRTFKYTTPKKRLTAQDLDSDLLLSRSFHLICSPSRCRELITDINAARRALCPPGTYVRPFYVWEPFPDSCTPDELLNCTNTLPLVDICSPNHAELAGFMGEAGLDPETGEISSSSIERSCEQLLASMPLQSFTLVVRAGEKGCYIARNGGRKRQTLASSEGSKRRKREYTRGGLQPDTDMEALFAGLLQNDEGIIAREEIEVDPGLERWIPAYHRDSSKVVDPTGGGNSFLGGLTIALARGESVEDAVAWASVSASFAIEQIGIPVLGKNDEGKETWNGIPVHDRLKEFQGQLQTPSASTRH